MLRAVLSSQTSTEPQVPAWLDQRYLAQLLAQEIPEFRNIISISTKQEQLVNPVLRVRLQVQLQVGTRIVNFMVKSAALNENVPVDYPLSGDWSQEYWLYDEVLPQFVTLYQQANRAIAFSASRHAVKAVDAKAKDCLYLDYLQAKNYRVINHPNGLERRQVEAVLAKLAAYHAASAAYLQTTPGKLKKPTNGYSKAQTNASKVAELNALLVRKFHESLYAHDLRCYEDQLKSYQQHVAHLALTDLDDDNAASAFNVLQLGACWPNNLLLHADAFGNVKDVLFVDFQYAQFGPAVYDLHHALFTLPCLADKLKLFDAYVRYYHDQLIEHLRLLNYPKPLPKLSDFQQSLLKYSHVAFEAITKILPIVLVGVPLHDLAELDEIFANKVYAQQLRQLVPWLQNRGYLEE